LSFELTLDCQVPSQQMTSRRPQGVSSAIFSLNFGGRVLKPRDCEVEGTRKEGYKNERHDTGATEAQRQKNSTNINKSVNSLARQHGGHMLARLGGTDSMVGKKAESASHLLLSLSCDPILRSPKGYHNPRPPIRPKVGGLHRSELRKSPSEWFFDCGDLR